MFFGVEGKLDEALEDLVLGEAGEVAKDEFLGEEAGDVAELEGFVPGGVYKVSVLAVDDDDVLVGVEAGAPEFAGSFLKGVTGNAFASGRFARFFLRDHGIGDGYEGVGLAFDFALFDKKAQAGEAGNGGRNVGDDFAVLIFELAFPFDNFPLESEIFLDRVAAAIAADSSKGLDAFDGCDTGTRRNLHAEERTGILKKLFLSGRVGIAIGLGSGCAIGLGFDAFAQRQRFFAVW